MTGADASKLIVRSACCFACAPRFADFGDARFFSPRMMKKSGKESHQIL
jgi:transcriptional regulator NrdR family protein